MNRAPTQDDRLSRVRLPADACFRESDGYDTIQLPSLVMAFKNHDATLLDRRGGASTCCEGSAEPALGVVFSPQKPEEVKTAVPRLAALSPSTSNSSS